MLQFCANDFTIGPVVRGCRNDFDFTLLFGQAFLSLLPSSIFALLAVYRILHLYKKPRKVGGGVFLAVKVVSLYTSPKRRQNLAYHCIGHCWSLCGSPSRAPCSCCYDLVLARTGRSWRVGHVTLQLRTHLHPVLSGTLQKFQAIYPLERLPVRFSAS
jgi:hypothetical protein